MFGHRTPNPKQKPTSGVESPPKPVTAAALNVRRSIGEWESGNVDPTPPMTSKTMQNPANTEPPSIPPKKKELTDARQPPQTLTQMHTPPRQQYVSRPMEAKACVSKGKLLLSTSRNTKTDIKNGVLEALDRLYQLVKEAELELKSSKSKDKALDKERGKEREEDQSSSQPSPPALSKEESKLLKQIEEHGKLLKENSERMKGLEETKVSPRNLGRLLDQGSRERNAADSRLIAKPQDSGSPRENLAKN